MMPKKENIWQQMAVYVPFPYPPSYSLFPEVFSILSLFYTTQTERRQHQLAIEGRLRTSSRQTIVAQAQFRPDRPTRTDNRPSHQNNIEYGRNLRLPNRH